MTSCVRVLSTQELDSSPSLLLVAPNGKKILVNCGEGCQRVFLEFGQKVSTIDMVCLTHLGHETIGGLPGMVLTASDVVKIATDNAKQVLESKPTKKKGNNKQGNKTDSSRLPGLKVLGPEGTNKFFRSLRHFMRRDSFFVDIQEGPGGQRGPNSESNGLIHKKKRDKGKNKSNNEESFLVQPFSAVVKTDPICSSIDSRISRSNKRPRTTEKGETGACEKVHNTSTVSQHLSSPVQSSQEPNTTSNDDSREILSFLFTTPPIQGRFLIEKAKALGVPRGPLYGQLKAGKTVTFPKSSSSGCDSETSTVTVESHQVVEPGSPGIVVAVLCYPCLDVLDQLKNSKEVKQFYQIQENEISVANTLSNVQKPHQDNKKPSLELVVHMTTRTLFESECCVKWRQNYFPQSVQHLFVRTEPAMDTMDSNAATQALSVFQSGHSGARLRSKVSFDVFRTPLSEIVTRGNDAANTTSQGQRNILYKQTKTDSLCNVIDAVPLLEYILLPRAKRGFSNHDLFFRKWRLMEEEARISLDDSGCLDRAKQILDEHGLSPLPTIEKHTSSHINVNMGGEILFTGTGSAVPCKHRNVSGIHVRMDNGNAILLDVGEGTVGQLLRAHQSQNHRRNGEEYLVHVLKNIKAVWISHPHADHHLGIIRLLEERQRLVNDHDPLVLIAPPNILAFLREYEVVVPQIRDSYIFLDCRTLKDDNAANLSVNHSALKRLQQSLGIQSCTAIPVNHCAHSFAVVFHGTSFGSLAYSGDCRPSKKFAEAAYNADILIHEATFADGMEADAVVKRHSTAGEALRVAKDMNAKTAILTHFSQRYPKAPPSSLSNTRVIHAFDFMTITPSNIPAASKLVPVLQMLYPDETNDTDKDGSSLKSDAHIALEVPGLFAQSELL